jgi:hypothetical protein
MATENETKLVALCNEIIVYASHGDYSNGVEGYGIDEGRVRAAEYMIDIENRLKQISDAAGINE